jgi:hypothetical protein
MRLTKVLADIKKGEKTEKMCEAGRKTIKEHVEYQYRVHRREPQAQESGRGRGRGRGRGLVAAAGGGRGGGGGQQPFIAPQTVGLGLEGKLDAPKAPRSLVSVQRGPGRFVTFYRGDYVQSFSWTLRGSSTEAAQLALAATWEAHEVATGLECPEDIAKRIAELDISRYNMAA